jgi:8-oxo-dGTP pyrophosphatase MutT (NUDIX family)
MVGLFTLYSDQIFLVSNGLLKRFCAMDFSFYNFLEKRLQKKERPGRTSQLKMAPYPVEKNTAIGKNRPMEAPPEADASSVLILIFPNSDNEWELILTLRTSDINHGGQLSCPGGRSEQGETEPQTALRETQEEIGINPNDVRIAGTLSKLYVSHSSNDVTPVVGFLDYTPKLNLNPAEVDEAFSVELDSLVDKKNLTVEDWDLRDQATYRVPYWDVHRVPLWGATAMMLSEFLELYREFKSQKTNHK